MGFWKWGPRPGGLTTENTEGTEKLTPQKREIESGRRLRFRVPRRSCHGLRVERNEAASVSAANSERRKTTKKKNPREPSRAPCAKRAIASGVLQTQSARVITPRSFTWVPRTPAATLFWILFSGLIGITVRAGTFKRISGATSPHEVSSTSGESYFRLVR